MIRCDVCGTIYNGSDFCCPRCGQQEHTEVDEEEQIMKQSTVTGKFIADALVEKKKELDEVVESIRILKDNSTLSHSVGVPIRILDLQRQALQKELSDLSNRRYVIYTPSLE